MSSCDIATMDDAPQLRSPNRAHDGCITPVAAVVCGGCSGRISDRYYFAAVGRRWHVSCLRCSVCSKQLDPTATSYVRNDRIYCGDDFRRLFMCRDCTVCRKSILPDEMVVAVVVERHRGQGRGHSVTCDSCDFGDDGVDEDTRVAVYHARCFRCVVCGASRSPLLPGEQYGIDSGRIYCRAHFCELKLVLGVTGRRAPPSPTTSTMGWLSHHRGRSNGECRTEKLVSGTAATGGNGCRTTGAASRGRPRKIKVSPDVLTGLQNPPAPEPQITADDVGRGAGDGPEPETDDRKDDHVTTDVSDDTMHDDGSSSTGACGSWEEPAGSGEPTVRRKRMRSSFKHHQLKVMKAYFQVNHNPDAKELREMSMKTGLLTRVIQVWFQNARAKFRRNLSKQHQHQPLQPQTQAAPPGAFCSEQQVHRSHHLAEHQHQYDQYQRRPPTSGSYIDLPEADILPGFTCGGRGIADAIACTDLQGPSMSSFNCRTAGCLDCVDAISSVPESVSGFLDYGAPSVTAIATVASDFYYR